MSEPNSPPEQPAGQSQDEPRDETQAPREPSAPDPRRRLRELLAVPERDRSDEQWDEIISLEIQLAPENRVSSGSPPGGGRQPEQGRGGNNQGRRQRPGPGNKPPRRFSKKSKRRSGAPVKA